MFQRVQTIYLLLACSVMLIASALPLASFLYDGNRMVVEAVGIYINGELSRFTWGLLGVGVVSAILALVSIFFYKKRKLQIRLAIIDIVLMAAFYIYFAFIVYKMSLTGSLEFVKMWPTLAMPAVAIILVVLAIRRISADEALVRSLDRLR